MIACNTPIVSAVGHETDFTICDFVADLRAPTPSAAAERVCPDINELAYRLSVLKSRLINYANIIVDDNMQYISELSHSPVLENYETVISTYQENIDVLKTRLNDSVSYILENKFMGLSALAGQLDALSPLAVLARGYLVGRKGNKIVKSVSQIEEKDKINIVLQDGKAICTVNEVVKNG